MFETNLKAYAPANIEKTNSRKRKIIEGIICVAFFYFLGMYVLGGTPVFIHYGILLIFGIPLSIFFFIGIGRLSVTEYLFDYYIFLRRCFIFPFRIPHVTEDEDKNHMVDSKKHQQKKRNKKEKRRRKEGSKNEDV